jgi:hypothetical protein
MIRTENRCAWLAILMLAAAGSAACGAKSATAAAPARMRGFHIDMNIAQFRGPYLMKELKSLADLGYDTIVWEVENNIRWETCPECVSPDAFTKEEFKDILAYSRSLGLEPIPLLQTIGHCEYVLKNDRYRPLAEVPDRIDQYCPRNPAVVPFLRKWIDEYLEVFGEVKYFHLGADEAYTLGECPRCKAYAAEHSLSALYIDHMNAMSVPLIKKGIRPVIWGDMLLHHPEALDKLSRKVVIFDWLYDRYYGFGEVHVWGNGNQAKEELDAATLERFGAYLYPLGDEPGRDPDVFYTADYLAANGFDVVVCPSSSCYGDSVFAPRTYFHMRNTYDSFRKGTSGPLKGAVLTSWTVHLFPWELQRTSIELPQFIAAHPDGDLAAFEKAYVREHFGVDDTGFFVAAGRLARRGLFNYAADLGFFKDAQPAPRGYVADRIEEMAKNGELEKELATCETRLREYREGLAQFGAYAKAAKTGRDELGAWDLAARNLINRTEASRVLLKARLNGAGPEIAAEAGRVLEVLRALRKETEAAVSAQVKPSRTAEMMQWMYDSMETALEKAAGRDGGNGGR